MENKTLPQLTDKILLNMNNLMSDKQFKIKHAPSVFGYDRSDRINPDFVTVFLHDSLGHIQQCISATKKILPQTDQNLIYEKWEKIDKDSYSLLLRTASINIKKLLELYQELEKKGNEIYLKDLIPFVYFLVRDVIKFYYLGIEKIRIKYKEDFLLVISEISDVNGVMLQGHIDLAVEKHNVIINSIIPRLYPLLLRFTSTEILSFKDLFYTKGSILLQWLDLSPNDVMVSLTEGVHERLSEEIKAKKPERIEPAVVLYPEDVEKGFKTLEKFFPEAGWENIDLLPDFCPYFMNILNLPESVIMLSPQNPLQLTLILFIVLEYLFQGLRQIKFNVLGPEGGKEESENIFRILEDWVLYKEIIIEKEFSVDLKSFTSQIVNQPDYYKNPYGIKTLSNLYMLTKNYFLPHFNVRLFGITKAFRNERLPSFYSRVSRLKRLLSRYNDELIQSAGDKEFSFFEAVTSIQNPWGTYRFDIPNTMSVRLDAVCGGKNSKIRTNATLIGYTLDIVTVLDWWINDPKSCAYNESPETLYRVKEKGSLIPSFTVVPRTDIEKLFSSSLK